MSWRSERTPNRELEKRKKLTEGDSSALRGVARALRCTTLRVLREHLVLPLGAAHLLRLVEGRAAARQLRGQGGETAPQRHSLRCKPVQHSAAWWAASWICARRSREAAVARYCKPRRVARGMRGAARGLDSARERARVGQPARRERRTS